MRSLARWLAITVTLMAGLAAVYAGATGIAFARSPTGSGAGVARPMHTAGSVRVPALPPPQSVRAPALARMPRARRAGSARVPGLPRNTAAR